MSSGRPNDSSVKVIVRVRPYSERELEEDEDDKREKCCLQKVGAGDKVTVEHPCDPMFHGGTFKFDKVIWSNTMQVRHNQERVYEEIGNDLIVNTLKGYNCCLFAYGQTGSGKTYTMMGDWQDTDVRGIIPRLCQDLFGKIDNLRKANPHNTLTVTASYMEIYLEQVHDLVDSKKTNLKARQHPTDGIYVEGLTKKKISGLNNILGILATGHDQRHVGSTKMNTRSSRSHALLTFYFTSVEVLESSDGVKTNTTEAKLNLVDLAGSERIKKSEVDGEAFTEATKINLSLTTLGRIIDSLADISSGRIAKKIVPPYRDSMLTWILSDSLGGNSKTTMLATVSPHFVNIEETMSTLRYASRAREIVNQAVINEDPSIRRIKQLTEEVERLRKELARPRARSSSDNMSELIDLRTRVQILEEALADETDKNRRLQARIRELEVASPVFSPSSSRVTSPVAAKKKTQRNSDTFQREATMVAENASLKTALEKLQIELETVKKTAERGGKKLALAEQKAKRAVLERKRNNPAADSDAADKYKKLEREHQEAVTQLRTLQKLKPEAKKKKKVDEVRKEEHEELKKEYAAMVEYTQQIEAELQGNTKMAEAEALINELDADLREVEEHYSIKKQEVASLEQQLSEQARITDGELTTVKDKYNNVKREYERQKSNAKQYECDKQQLSEQVGALINETDELRDALANNTNATAAKLQEAKDNTQHYKLELSKATKESEQIYKDYTYASEQLKAVNLAFATLKSEHTEFLHKQGTANSQVAALQAELSHQDKENQTLLDTVHSLKEQLASSETQYTAVTAKNIEFRDAERKLTDEVRRLNSINEAQAADVDYLYNEEETLRAKQMELEEQQERRIEEVFELREQNTLLTEKCAVQETQNEEFLRELDELHTELTSSRDRDLAQSAEITSLKLEVENVIRDNEQLHLELNAVLGEQQMKSARSDTEQTELQRNITSLQVRLQETETDLRDQKQVFKEKEGAFMKRIDMLQKENDGNDADTQHLREALGSIRTEMEFQNSENELLHTTVMSLKSKVKDMEQHTEENIVSEEHLNTELFEVKQHSATQKETIDLQESELSSCRHKIVTLQRELETRQGDSSIREQEVTAYRQEACQTRDDLKILKAKHEVLRNKEASLERELHERDAEVDCFRTKCTALQDKLEEVARDGEQWRGDLTHREQVSREQDKELEVLRATVNQNEKCLGTKDAEAAELIQTIEDLQAQHALQKANLGVHLLEIQSKDQQIEDLKAEALRIQEEKAALTMTADNQRGDIRELLSYKGVASDLENKLQDLKEQQSAINHSQATRETYITEQDALISKYKEQADVSQNGLAIKEQELQQCKEQLAELEGMQQLMRDAVESSEAKGVELQEHKEQLAALQEASEARGEEMQTYKSRCAQLEQQVVDVQESSIAAWEQKVISQHEELAELKRELECKTSDQEKEQLAYKQVEKLENTVKELTSSIDKMKLTDAQRNQERDQLQKHISGMLADVAAEGEDMQLRGRCYRAWGCFVASRQKRARVVNHVSYTCDVHHYSLLSRYFLKMQMHTVLLDSGRREESLSKRVLEEKGIRKQLVSLNNDLRERVIVLDSERDRQRERIEKYKKLYGPITPATESLSPGRAPQVQKITKVKNRIQDTTGKRRKKKFLTELHDQVEKLRTENQATVIKLRRTVAEKEAAERRTSLLKKYESVVIATQCGNERAEGKVRAALAKIQMDHAYYCEKKELAFQTAIADIVTERNRVLASQMRTVGYLKRNPPKYSYEITEQRSMEEHDDPLLAEAAWFAHDERVRAYAEATLFIPRTPITPHLPVQTPSDLLL